MSRHLNQERIVLAITVLLFALFSVSLPRFLTVENVLTLVRSVSVLGILGAAALAGVIVYLLTARLPQARGKSDDNTAEAEARLEAGT